MRKKLKLRVDELNVESFASARAEEERGTVRGEQATADTGCRTCDGYVTNDWPWQECVIC